MIDSEKLFELARIFDNERTKVVGELPPAIRISEVVGIQNYPDKTSKVSVSRWGKLYLCWVETSEAMSLILKLKQEIQSRSNPEERWEPWEIYGSEEPRNLVNRIIKSRLRLISEKHEEYSGTGYTY